MKILYAVSCYDDGTLGIFSTPKKAWKMAKSYLKGEPTHDYDEEINYSKFLKMIKEREFIRVTLRKHNEELDELQEEREPVTVRIENFVLNYNYISHEHN